MIDDYCKVPREDLDDGFNPCRKQVVENGKLESYAHMYDVMNERYDREEDTTYLTTVKRDKINPNTHTSIARGDNVALYSQNRVTKSEEQLGVLGSGSLNLDKRDDSVMTSKAVVDYVTANIPDISELEAEIDGKLNKVTVNTDYDQVYVKSTDGNQTMMNVSNTGTSVTPTSGRLITGKGISEYAQPKAKVKDGLGTVSGCNASGDALDRVMVGNMEMSTASDGSSTIPSTAAVNTALATKQDKLTLPLSIEQGGTGAQSRRLKTAAGLTLLPVIDSIGASGALNGYTSVTNIATFITTNNIRPEITAAFENNTAEAVADNDLLPTNALMMGYVNGNLINYNDITVSGGGTSNIIYNRIRLKNNNCIYGDCDFTVNSEGDDGGVKVNIIINGTDINIPPVFTKFILSNKPLLVHKSSNTIIEGKNIYNVSNGKVIIQFNIGDFNTGEFIFIVDSVFTGYNQPM